MYIFIIGGIIFVVFIIYIFVKAFSDPSDADTGNETSQPMQTIPFSNFTMEPTVTRIELTEKDLIYPGDASLVELRERFPHYSIQINEVLIDAERWGSTHASYDIRLLKEIFEFVKFNSPIKQVAVVNYFDGKDYSDGFVKDLISGLINAEIFLKISPPKHHIVLQYNKEYRNDM